MQTFYSQLDATVASARDPAKIEETRSNIATTARLSDIRKSLTALDEANQKLADERTASLNAAFQTGTMTLIGGGIMAALIAVAIGDPVDTQPCGALRGMTLAMRKLAEGDTSIDIRLWSVVTNLARWPALSKCSGPMRSLR